MPRVTEPNTHDALRDELERGWMENTDCDRATAEIRADMDMGNMHQSETCPVCHPPCADCGRMWHSCTCGDDDRSVSENLAGSGGCVHCGYMLSSMCPDCRHL